MAAVSAEDDCSNTTTGADVTSSILTKDSAPAAANSNARIELDEEEEEPSSTCIEEIHGDDDVFLTPSESPFPPESVNTVIPSPLDPLAESYRSVIELINRTSQGFKEGQKWKCNHSCGTRQPNRKKRLRDRLTGSKDKSSGTCRCKRLCSQCDSSFEDRSQERKAMLSHSKTMDYSSQARRNRQLFRQMATYESEEHEEGKRKSTSGRSSMPRQWTTADPMSDPMNDPLDSLSKSKAVSSPMVMSNNSNAFLLRPVSRNSYKPPEELTSPAAKAAIAAAIAAAGGGPGSNGGRGRKSPLAPPTSTVDQVSMTSLGAEIHSAPNGTLASRIRRQRTTESAPTGGPLLSGGVAIRHMPRQLSNASAYSYSMAVPSTFSNQGITLVRGASCSLVDIPTYLGPALHTSTGVVQMTSSPSNKLGAATNGSFAAALDKRAGRPRLQLDLTKKNNNNKSAKSTRKTKWTILCVGLTLLTMCVTLVGTMLSIGSQYQHQLVHRKWEQEMGGSTSAASGNKSNTLPNNKTSTTMSPLIPILKVSIEDDSKRKGGDGDDDPFVIDDKSKRSSKKRQMTIDSMVSEHRYRKRKEAISTIGTKRPTAKYFQRYKTVSMTV